MIECPRFLFPFARRIIADLTAEGGFPPFMLEPIDFAGIYAAPQGRSRQPSRSGRPEAPRTRARSKLQPDAPCPSARRG